MDDSNSGIGIWYVPHCVPMPNVSVSMDSNKTEKYTEMGSMNLVCDSISSYYKCGIFVSHTHTQKTCMHYTHTHTPILL